MTLILFWAMVGLLVTVSTVCVVHDVRLRDKVNKHE